MEHALFDVTNNLLKMLTVVTEKLEACSAELQILRSQNQWFKNQIFGKKTERRPEEPSPQAFQLPLFPDSPSTIPVATEPVTPVQGYQRGKAKKIVPPSAINESGLRYDSTVPVEVEVIVPAEVRDLPSDQYRVIDEEISERLCERKSSYYIKRTIRKKVEYLGNLYRVPAPMAPIDSHYADPSILVGLAVAKFLYHQPLYRQHQKMKAAGVYVARSTLTNWMVLFSQLLTPIAQSVLASVVRSNIVGMDETGHKVQGKKKLDQGFLWTLFGDKNEVAVVHTPTRGHKDVMRLLGEGYKGTILSDGLSAYNTAAKVLDVAHANCWSHARRQLLKAENEEPKNIGYFIALIRKLYALEEDTKGMSASEKRAFREEHHKPLVEQFFATISSEHERILGLPQTPYAKALGYVITRKKELTLFLDRPEVPLDTNHVEREIRQEVMSRKNYGHCCSELGADAVGVFHTLFLSCRIQKIDPWEYLLDVIKRIDIPGESADDLTPRRWKERFHPSIE